MKTPFHLVSEMNEAFGNPKGDPEKINGPKLVRQCKNIGAEFQELMSAFGIRVDMEFKDHTEASANPIPDIRDALCDIMVFALGAYHFMGFDADEDMEEVIRCVMTRFCKDEAQLHDTIKHYDALGVSYYVEGQFPRMYLKSSKDQQMPEYPKGKFLKAVGYEKPTFAPAPTLVERMARERVAIKESLDRKRSTIERQVKEYRAKLELDAFGTPGVVEHQSV